MFYFLSVLVVFTTIFQFGNLANTATRIPATASNPKATTPPINDTDYWDFDDFVPFKNDRHDTFDWKLLKAVILAENTNIIVSPFSVKIVLALLSEAAGAESNTQRELSQLLPNIRSPNLMREHYKRMLNSLYQPNDNYELNIGTKMYVDSFIEPRQRFASIAEAHYEAKIERLDFHNSQLSANIINNWCSNITNGHIPKLVSKDDIESSVMLLINAIYFDGIWRKPFIENQSFDFVFYVQPQKEIRTTFMTQVGRFYFFDSAKLNAKIIRLPYKGKKFAMTIILPGAKGGLDELIREIEGDGLKRLQWLMDESEVKVTIPKFKFEYTSHLKATLENLGINEMFTSSASLPGLDRGAGLRHQLQVSNIIQKCGLIVHEKGTTAFGATDVSLANKFGDTTVREFNANRPFMFLIEDETTGTILFAGKVTDPTK